MKESKRPQYLSEYLDEIIEEGQEQRRDGKINWKYILILLLPFGTLLLIGLLLLKKLNKKTLKPKSRTNSKKSVIVNR